MALRKPPKVERTDERNISNLIFEVVHFVKQKQRNKAKKMPRNKKQKMRKTKRGRKKRRRRERERGKLRRKTGRH